MSKLSPFQGVGIGYRLNLDQFIRTHKDEIDVLEVIPEHYGRVNNLVFMRHLASLRGSFKLVVHGISSNIVSTSRPEKSYLELCKVLLDVTGSPYFSDHIAMTRVETFQLGHLCPSIFDTKILKKSIDHILEIEEFLKVPIVLEYTTYPFRFPGSSWSPEQFFIELVNSCPSAGVLLDLSNVWYNSLNFSFNDKDFIRQIPPDRIVHIHLAGGEMVDNYWHDTHSQEIHAEVFDLLEFTCSFSQPDTIIIERDSNYTQAVVDLPLDLSRARKIQMESINGICDY